MSLWLKERRGDADHLDFQQGLITIIQEVFCFSAIDSDDTEQELTAETEGHDFDFLAHDST